MNMLARFDENPAMTLQDIKKIKCYGRTDARTDAHTQARMHGQCENSKLTTNKVCGGYKYLYKIGKSRIKMIEDDWLPVPVT